MKYLWGNYELSVNNLIIKSICGTETDENDPKMLKNDPKIAKS